MDRLKGFAKLAIWIAGLIGIGSLLGALTRGGMSPWYENIQRSPLTPPGYVFGIAWTLLYACIGTAGWLLWQKANTYGLRRIFAVQLLLNWAWTPLFFYWHLTGWSLLCIASLWLCVAALILLSYRSMKLFAWLLVPYFLWLSFAAYLNLYIYQNN